ncbi:hypothetical protein [Levilactobacillus brevis]|uniref:hypothetical protein n=1 Tax=Levilactobacillus brevis TaxID=1580 RepID=UPI00111A3288|nr:hypothetical protein [Levilactobacillus brevis]QCZ44823.1 hypothetical protein UCCLBBS124_pA0025 [Levilactobacillus brevis]
MDIFKAKTGSALEYDISRKNYEHCSKRLTKYGNLGGTQEDHYGVGTACDDPILLIGFYRVADGSNPKSYERHNKGSIEGLISYSEIDYLNCPYSKPNQRHKQRYKRPESPMTRKILKTVVTQFDRIIYLLNKQTGLHMTKGLAKLMLEEYLNKEGWRFHLATMSNIPWTFAECSRARPLFGRYVTKDSELYRVLKDKCPEVVFEETDYNQNIVQVKSDKKFITLQFVFLYHNQTPKEEHLTETIDFLVFRPAVSGEDEVLFQIKLPVDTNYFANLVNDKRHQERRNQALLKMADSLVPAENYES